MKIRYTRQGGHRPPRDDERLEIDQGRFTLWRTVSSATYPPTPIGSFAGELPAAEWDELREMITAAVEEGDLQRQIAPDSPIETIRAGDVTARLGIHDEPEGAWGAVIARLRDLLRQCTGQPAAALSLTVSSDGKRATLKRLGTETLDVDLSWSTVRAVLWEEEWQNKGSWSDAVEDGPAEETEEGWSYELPFGHGFTPEQNQQVVAYLTMKVRRDGTEVDASLESPRT
jgi:hypothetical protein